MRFELNEIEARREQYPSTISFINLLNTLIAAEKDVSDRGHRYWTFYDWTYHIMVSSLYSLVIDLILISSYTFADSLASLNSFMIMCLGHSRREPMPILVRSGNLS